MKEDHRSKRLSFYSHEKKNLKLKFGLVGIQTLISVHVYREYSRSKMTL